MMCFLNFLQRRHLLFTKYTKCVLEITANGKDIKSYFSKNNLTHIKCVYTTAIEKEKKITRIGKSTQRSG